MITYKELAVAAAVLACSAFSTASAQWSLSGNSAGASDFIGSTNSAPFRVVTGGSERARIDPSGNVGIGTTNPSRRLHIHNDPTAPQIRFSDHTGDSWDLWGGYDLHLTTAAGVEWLELNEANQSIQIGPNDDMYVNINTGNVGLGTTSPNARLTIDGTITPSANCTYTFGRSGRRWRAIYARQGTINTSDARLKENIQDISYGLDAVMQLHPVSFSWKNDPEYGAKLGLLAQEVQPVINEVVKTGDDGEMGIFYDDLIPVLIKAVQQQQTSLQAETAETDRLNTELDMQARRIAELEAALNITD